MSLLWGRAQPALYSSLRILPVAAVAAGGVSLFVKDVHPPTYIAHLFLSGL